MLPFAVFDAAARRRHDHLHEHRRSNKRVEIGSTWYAGPRAAPRPLNTECKLMLLAHAFEALDCIAVEFRTHRLNTQSRRAIERLGAQLDGILRAHQRRADGTAARHRRLQHHRGRVADVKAASRPATRQAALTRPKNRRQRAASPWQKKNRSPSTTCGSSSASGALALSPDGAQAVGSR